MVKGLGRMPERPATRATMFLTRAALHARVSRLSAWNFPSAF